MSVEFLQLFTKLSLRNRHSSGIWCITDRTIDRIHPLVFIMRKLSFALVLISFFLFLISCQDTENEILEMRVSHHQQTGYGFIGPRILYRVQVGDEIGGEEWNGTFTIENFDYEWGYTYDILVAKKYYNYDGPVADAPEFRYVFLKEFSKQRVEPGTQFDLFLKRTYDDGVAENLVEENKEKGFTILGTKSFDCADLCDELTKEREDRTVLTGTFEFLDDGKIKLVALKSQFFR